MAAAFADPGYSMEPPAPAERHYAPAEVAELWQFNVETIRRMFEDEPGVVVLQGPLRKGNAPIRPSEFRTVSWSAFTDAFRGNIHTLCSNSIDAT